MRGQNDQGLVQASIAALQVLTRQMLICAMLNNLLIKLN